MKPADTLNIVFSSFLLLLTLFFFGRVPHSRDLVLIYSSLIFFQIAVVRLSALSPALRVIRDIVFPVFCVLIIFDSLGLLVHSINPVDLDYLLIRIDYKIFGCYPTVMMEGLVNPFLTDVLQAAYSTYYFLPVSLGIVLKLKGRDEDFERSLFLILLCFYLSYIGYLLFPALGPRYAIQHLQHNELDGFLVSKPIQNVLNLIEGVKRDAFPSGHTGIALTVLFLACRYARGLFLVLIVPVMLLIVATVYCRYHYVVDVAGGLVLTVVTIIIGEVYYTLRMRRKSYGYPVQQD